MEKKWQAIFFDFDGVILDSVHVKTRAFAKMFRDYGPEIEKQVVDYHLAHGGVSRFEKFRYFYEVFLRKPVSDAEIEKLGEQFSDLALEEVLNSPFIEGAEETLEQVRKENILSFVVSGTPDEEMKQIVNLRNLWPYFKEVHGSPTHKDEHVRDIAKRYDLNLANCLFIGDSTTDYDAATAAGTQFLGVVPRGKSSPFPEGTTIRHKLDITA